jgi:hypothetical protein
MPKSEIPFENPIDKEFVRERGKALLKQITGELQINGKLTFNDEEKRMQAFHRATELVDQEKSKLTNPEQQMIREYLREGLLGSTDPDKWLDLHLNGENVEESLAHHELAKYEYGSLLDQLMFCAIPQMHAHKTPLQKLIGVLFLIACAAIIVSFPFVLFFWFVASKSIHIALFPSLLKAFGVWAGVSAGVILIFMASARLAWQLRKIEKANQIEYKRIHDARHGKSD